MPNPEAFHTLGDKYIVRRVLGHGGMGSVFEVENVLTGKRAAVKRLHPRIDALDDAESRSRVVHEARATARIHHRNVVDVYDVFEDGGRVCLVMELLIGELLSARVKKGGVTLHQYIAWLLAAMRGVAAGHAAGVIHRDIKPENIFLARDASDADPVPVVIDFGVSKLYALDGDTRPGEVTHSGMAMGTPRYVSYEQLRGARDVDGRTDVYAFGVMLYEAIAGRAPYEADSFPEQAIRFLTTEPTELRSLRPSVPYELAALVRRAIARERSDRPASMQAFVEALSPYAERAAYALSLEAFPPAEGGRNTVSSVASAVAQPEPALPPAIRSGRSAGRLVRSAGWLAALGSVVCVAALYVQGQTGATDSLQRATRHGRAAPASAGGIEATRGAQLSGEPFPERHVAPPQRALSQAPAEHAEQPLTSAAQQAERHTSPGRRQAPSALANPLPGGGPPRRTVLRAGPMQRSEF